MLKLSKVLQCYAGAVQMILLVGLNLTCATPLERRDDNGKTTSTVMMNIDGHNVPVELPVAEIPDDMPQFIHSKPRDERLDESSVVILPNQLPEAPSFPLPRDGNLTSPSPPLGPPTAPAPAPPAPAPAPPAPAPAPPAPAPVPPAPAPTPPAPTPPTPTPVPQQQPLPPSPSPPSTPVATTAKPVTSPTSTAPKNNTSNVVLATWLPMFGVPFFTNNLFGPIFPVFTPHPQVIQYITSPPVYYMQVLQIVHTLIPANTIPINSIMDLSMAVTNIMRSNAESLSSLVVEEPDGPNLAPIVQNAYGDNGFRSNVGETSDIPTPNDITTQIQNAVQTYAQPMPDEVQNELTKALSENVAELLKPLYQNIAYTRKLRLGDTGEQLERRDYSFLQRRSPNDTVVVPVPAVNVTLPSVNATLPTVNTTIPAVNTTLPAVNSTLPAVNTTPTAVNSTLPPVNSTLPAVNPTPPTPPSVNTTNNNTTKANTTAPDIHIPTLPTPNAVMPTLNVPNLTNTMNGTSVPAPSPIQPIVINNNIDPSTKNISNLGANLMNELLSTPTSALSSFPSLLSFIPNPFKIVYGFMNTIATCYPKIQLSILVGLSTAVTQIVARVLEMIASFVGIFAAIGRKRRDLSSGDVVPASIDMDQMLKGLHSDIKEAVNTYLPDAPPNVKKELTSGLYQNSLETINEALIPMGEQIKKNSQNAETNNPTPADSPPPAPPSNLPTGFESQTQPLSNLDSPPPSSNLPTAFEQAQPLSNLAVAPDSPPPPPPPPPNNLATAPDYTPQVEVPPQPSSPIQDANPENLRTNLFGFQVPDIVIKLDDNNNNNNNNNELSLSNALLGTQAESDGLQKQVNQFTNDLIQLPQDILGLSNYDNNFQQNNGRQNLKNQNDILSWNK
ncbi:hypothetical protein WDU94_008785 [Cyamophila willieti]